MSFTVTYGPADNRRFGVRNADFKTAAINAFEWHKLVGDARIEETIYHDFVDMQSAVSWYQKQHGQTTAEVIMAALASDSFSEDWDSPEDEYYDTL